MKLTLTEFIEKLYDLNINIVSKNNLSEVYDYQSRTKINTNVDYAIREKVIVGGYDGGNCWGDEAEAFYNYDATDELYREFEKVLDSILYEFCPNITYLQYKKIRELIKEDSFTEWEYYGNSTDYNYLYILIKDLYETISKIV